MNDPVVPDPLVLPSQAMLDTIQGESESSSLYSFLPERGVDVATWSPSMWWLLNWWTWQFPPPSASSTNAASETQMYTVEYVVIQSDDHQTSTAPTLAALPSQDDEGPGPTQLNAIVNHTINMGNGLLDLFA